jgi:serine/threonine-protein kinase
VGLVADQNPAYGAQLKKGSAIDVSVNFSNGSDAIVPTVTGLEEQTAVNVAETTNLVPLVTEQYSEVVAEGLCAAQSPSPGAEAKTGDTLVIVMSRGKEPAKAKVPDVKGKKQSDAESPSQTQASRPRPSRCTTRTSTKKVITQLPDAGSGRRGGSTVQIVVSLGKGVGAATVPSVKGKNEATPRTRSRTPGWSRAWSSSTTPT